VFFLLLLLLRSKHVAVALEDTAKLATAGVYTFFDNILARLDVVVAIHPVGVVFF
jgi:hypothetical protein